MTRYLAWLLASAVLLAGERSILADPITYSFTGADPINIPQNTPGSPVGTGNINTVTSGSFTVDSSIITSTGLISLADVTGFSFAINGIPLFDPDFHGSLGVDKTTGDFGGSGTSTFFDVHSSDFFFQVIIFAANATGNDITVEGAFPDSFSELDGVWSHTPLAGPGAEPSAVPEPSTFTLLAIAALGCIAYYRYRGNRLRRGVIACST